MVAAMPAHGGEKAREVTQNELQKAQEALQQVRKAYHGEEKGMIQDFNKYWKLLQSVKIFVTVNPLGSFTTTEPASLLKAVALVGRECFELAALLSVQQMQHHQEQTEGGSPADVFDETIEGEDDFERHMMMLLPYYTDYADLLPPSQYRNELLCLHLLHFLAANRIGEFHMALQTLAPEVHSNPLVGEVLTLEQHLMEGSYGFIFDLQRQQQANGKRGSGKQNALPQSSRVFIDKLVRTVRLKAAACLERAHNEVDLQYAMQTLNLPTVQDLQGFVEIHNLGKQQAAAMAVSASSNVGGSEGTGGVHSLLNHGGGAGGGGSVSTLAAGVGSGSFASAVFIGGALLGDEVDMQWKIQGKKLLFVKGNRTQQQSAHQQCTLQAIQVIGNLVERKYHENEDLNAACVMGLQMKMTTSLECAVNGCDAEYATELERIV